MDYTEIVTKAKLLMQQGFPRGLCYGRCGRDDMLCLKALMPNVIARDGQFRWMKLQDQTLCFPDKYHCLSQSFEASIIC